MYGVTAQGFVKKTLAEVQAESTEDFVSIFGEGINLTPQSPLGQIKNIQDERELKLWELAEAVYFSQFPLTASGVNLDNAVAFNGLVRKAATFSRIESGRARGTFGTTIPAGTVISVFGDTTSRFVTDSAANIDVAAVDEVQTIEFSAIPDSGAWSISFDNEETASLAFNANAAAIEAALEALPSIGAGNITVSGNYTSGFTLTFGGALAGQALDLVQIQSNTLEISSVGITTTVTETTAGDQAKTALMFLTAETAGSIAAPTSSLTVIETPVVGLDSFINESAADIGADQETDVQLKLRRQSQLQSFSSGTVNAIRSAVLGITDVDAVTVFENNTNATDSESRPPHSVDVIVEGGTNAEIAPVIFDVVSAGIAYFGSISVSVDDDQGFAHIVKFSRPVELNIYIDLVLTTTSSYAGDDAVKAAIIEYGSSVVIGQNVVVYGTNALINSLDDVEGITDAVIRIGAATIPTAGNATFTASDDAGDLLIEITAHGLALGNRVKVSSADTLPTGLAAATNYFIVEVDTDDFKLSATRGGDPIAYTDAGTGTHTVFYGESDDNLILTGREKAIYQNANITITS